MVQKEYFKSQIDVRVIVANRFVRTVHFNATFDRMSHHSKEFLHEMFVFIVKYILVKYATAFVLITYNLNCV